MAGPLPSHRARGGGSLPPPDRTDVRYLAELHPGFLPESEVILLFHRLPTPRICSHSAGSTFNSSRVRPRMTDRGGGANEGRGSDSPAFRLSRGHHRREPLNNSHNGARGRFKRRLVPGSVSSVLPLGRVVRPSLNNRPPNVEFPGSEGGSN